MSKSVCQFHGPPCFRHSNYVFYKAFKYKCDYQIKVLALGDFFFLKILPEIPVCIGEVELLWEDRASKQLLSSLRLYFRPEHTPNGRHDHTGQDEVIALGERLVLRLEDLTPLIQQGIRWTYGCPTSLRAVQANSHPNDCETGVVHLKNGGCRVDHEGASNGPVVSDGNSQRRNLNLDHLQTDRNETSTGAANLAIMSYAKYCRYRAVQKRLEDCDSQWLLLAVVMAVGGFPGKAPGCRVMFCRDTFYQSEIDDLDIRMDYMLPVLKNSHRGKKSRQLSQQDSDSIEEMLANVGPSMWSSRPSRLTESSEISEEKVSTAEQAFLIGLHKFMHDIKMPIDIVPSFGSRQIDLYDLYGRAQRLGGYDSITHKRMWRQLYDKLGGESGNSNAATCIRKHYERLLLPYERHLRNLKVRKGKRQPQQRGCIQSGHRMTRTDNDGMAQCLEKENVRRTLSESSQNSQPEKASCQEKLVPNVTKPVPNVTKPVHTLIKSVPAVIKLEPAVTKSVPDVIKSVPDVIKSVPVVIKSEPAVIKSVPVVIKSVPAVIKSEPAVTEHSRAVLQVGTEHSRADLQVGTEVLEMPLVRQSGSTYLPSMSGTNMKNCQRHSSVQQQQPETSTLVDSTLGLSDSPSLPYTGMVYTGGYLVPAASQPMMHNPWGAMEPSPASVLALHTKASGTELLLGSQIREHSNPSLLSSKAGEDSVLDIGSKLPTKMSSSQVSANNIQTAAHTNEPYKPSPYLLSNPIQPMSHSSSRHVREPFGNSSHRLANILHPKPPGHKSHLHLPPPPSTVFLHPSSHSSFSPIQTSIASTAPSAHCHPRKRAYPFDFPTAASNGLFPSPDTVLNRIRNSTGISQSNARLAIPATVQQRFDDPRKIFQQTPQSVTVSQSVSLAQKTEPRLHQELTSSNSPQGHQTQYSRVSSQQGQHRSSSKGQVVDQIASAHLNGVHSPRQNSQSVTSASSVPSSSKDGRLTSALFGTQFTALPRASKSSDHTQEPKQVRGRRAASIVLSPHLHPAFMSSYLPAGRPSAASPQLQMLAGTLASPAQLAAYEEMFRNNGLGPFVATASAGTPSKKS